MSLLVAVGAALFWPALTTPFFLDDYLHSAMAHGRFPGNRGPFGLYDFVGEDNRQALIERGFLPWWTEPHLTLRFLRPLSSALLFYEHRWIGAWPGLMHAHSFLWWIAAVFAARWLFRACLPPRAAGLATIIFALAPCHALPLGWLANREALVSLTFGTLALAAFLRWKNGAGARWAALSFVAFSLALLAGEYAIGCLGYIVAFTWLSPAGAPRRWRGSLLFVLPALTYLAARRLLGYGAEGSGFYQDPLRDTWLFVSALPWRLVSLVMSGWFTQDATAWSGLCGDSRWPVALVGVVFAWGLWLALTHVTSSLSADARRTTWTFVAGSLLSLVPVLSVLPSVRLLGVAMLGIAPAIAVLLEGAWLSRDAEARHGLEEWTAIAATLLGFAHLVHGPGRAIYSARQIRGYALDFAAHTVDLAKRLDGRSAPEVVVVRGLDDVFFYGFALEGFGVPHVHWTVLSHTGHVLCRRLDASTIELLVGADTALYSAYAGDLYRSETHPILPGEVLPQDGFSVAVSELGIAGPRRAQFQFATGIDDPRRLWVGESRARGFYDASPPKVGFGIPFDP